MGTNWMIEGTIDPRWPLNTRGNIGEVFPEVVTALGYHLGIVPAERAWRETYHRLGIHADGDFSSDDPVILGLYGGYTYLNVSYLRVMGVRAPGSSPEAIDATMFGEGDPPPYEERPGDKNLRSSLRILRTALRALSVRSLPDAATDSFARTAAYESTRPALDAPTEELFEFLWDFPRVFAPVFGNHMETTALSAIVSGVLSDAAGAAGEPGLVTHLIGAAGDVHSARYSHSLYEIARTVRSTPSVGAEFDDGIDGLLDRLRDSSDAGAFLAAFDGFVTEHGHRGPNDWELSARTWDNTPELALSAIDAMRKADHDLSPGARLAGGDQRRQAAIDKIRPHVKRADRFSFDRAVKAVGFWAQGREATRDRAVRVMLPAKQVFRELVRRAAEHGGDPDPVRVALLDPRTELPGYVANPSSMLEVIAERAALFDRYDAVTPPFFITSADEVPTIEEMEAATPTAHGGATSGDVLTGDAGSSGVARGPVRVVHDPQGAADLEPGDVLVAPLTDPSWTPMFLPAAAVVVNVGALMSHAVIVARELGVPCVVAVNGATERLQDGMMVEVDGTAGTVTVLSDAEVSS